MRPSLFAGICCLAFAAGCGETKHPVRQQTIDPTESPGSAAPAPQIGTETGPAERPPMPVGDSQPDLSEMKVPEGWVRQQPRVSLILAEFALPKADGDPLDGRLTVSTAGGTVEENVDRWQGQFDDLQGNRVEKMDVAGREVTLVDLRGTYKDQRGPFAPVEMRPGYRVLGGIIPREGEDLFIKAYGPDKTMAEHEAAFREFVRSLVPAG